MTSLYVFSRGANAGHRGEYDAVFKKEFLALGIMPIFVERITLAMLGQDIFFAMIEEAPASFLLCAVASLIFRNRTIGLLFRPGECFRRDRVKYRVKHAIFRVLRHMATVRVLTILPFSVDERFAQVADDWVYDPQLWDRQTPDCLPAGTTTQLSREVFELANGRALIVALGGQNRGKGFDYLCDLWLRFPELRHQYLTVAAGQISVDSRARADRFCEAGGAVFDRFISAEELISLYDISNLIWASYHPDYDQASGIVGRAFQFGVPVILRRGSYMASLMRDLDSAAIEISYEDPSEAVRQLMASTASALERRAYPTRAIAAMQRRFAQTLVEALNVEQATNASRIRHRGGY